LGQFWAEIASFSVVYPLYGQPTAYQIIICTKMETIGHILATIESRYLKEPSPQKKAQPASCAFDLTNESTA
jgi:hypothetical protein